LSDESVRRTLALLLKHGIGTMSTLIIALMTPDCVYAASVGPEPGSTWVEEPLQFAGAYTRCSNTIQVRLRPL
jgi:hypothetical protein